MVEVVPEGPLEKYSFDDVLLLEDIGSGRRYFATSRSDGSNSTALAEVKPIPDNWGRDLAFKPRAAFRWSLQMSGGLSDGEYIVSWKVTSFDEPNFPSGYAKASLRISRTC
jgi:hypothetical protein